MTLKPLTPLEPLELLEPLEPLGENDIPTLHFEFRILHFEFRIVPLWAPCEQKGPEWWNR